MLIPLDLERIQASLRTPNGWIELATIALCFAIAWAVGSPRARDPEANPASPVSAPAA
jgi:hypothetical protein